MPIRVFMNRVLVGLWLFSSSTSMVNAVDYIAGLQPSQRPDQAPLLTEVQKEATWYAHALKGVEPPYPYSLRFLEDQGYWFTPFNHAGMTPPYDLRAWHSK